MLETLVRWLSSIGSGMEKQGPRCACCGTCCEAFGGHLNASRRDVERWRQQGRDDLLQRVNRLGWIWVDPQTKLPEERCPFLERLAPGSAICTVHETKPEMCRHYPTLAHGRRCPRGQFQG